MSSGLGPVYISPIWPAVPRVRRSAARLKPSGGTGRVSTPAYEVELSGAGAGGVVSVPYQREWVAIVAGRIVAHGPNFQSVAQPTEAILSPFVQRALSRGKTPLE